MVFARVSTVEETTDSIEESIRRTPDVLKRAEALSGFEGVYYLVDRSSGKTLTITLWETEEAMRNSEEAANRIRTDEAAASGGKIVSVDHFEVAAAELR